MAKQVHIDAQLEWRVAQDPQTGSWIAVCEPLKQTALGDTFNDLVHNGIREVMNELFFDLVQSNELERFLHNHGWRLRSPVPVLEDDERYEFDVPFDLIAAEFNGAGGMSRVSR